MRQRVELDRRLVQRVPRLVRGQLPLAQQVDVRARGGQRRAQLVRRVGDEAPLRADRLLERREHLVEPGRQASELVVADDLDALVQVARRRHGLGRGRQAPDRAQRRRGDERGERGRDGDADAADQDDPEADPVQRLVGRLERRERDHRAAAAQPVGVVPRVDRADRLVAV